MRTRNRIKIRNDCAHACLINFLYLLESESGGSDLIGSAFNFSFRVFFFLEILSRFQMRIIEDFSLRYLQELEKYPVIIRNLSRYFTGRIIFNPSLFIFYLILRVKNN